MAKINIKPGKEGFVFPPEWHLQEAMWLSFPKNLDTWEDRLPSVYPSYCAFIKVVSQGQKVCINVDNAAEKLRVSEILYKYDALNNNISIYEHPTNDAWCRDHGPAFLINPKTKTKLVVDWGYNAWVVSTPLLMQTIIFQ
jgi:agmatine deiminase